MEKKGNYLNIPVYLHPATYARENGELEAYRQSRSANIACRNAIEHAIDRQFDGLHLASDAAQSVIDQFGPDRTAFVLACTVLYNSWDGRYSVKNREWAEGMQLDDEFIKSDSPVWCVSSHPAVLDGFATQAHRIIGEMRETELISADEVEITGIASTTNIGNAIRETVYRLSCVIRGKDAVIVYRILTHPLDNPEYSFTIEGAPLPKTAEDVNEVYRKIRQAVNFYTVKGWLETDCPDAVIDTAEYLEELEKDDMSEAQWQEVDRLLRVKYEVMKK